MITLNDEQQRAIEQLHTAATIVAHSVYGCNPMTPWGLLSIVLN